jgi:hypothetical protein
MQVLPEVISPPVTDITSDTVRRRAVARRAKPPARLAAPENRDYFRGPVNVARVKAWRSRNPGYWRKRRRARVALQDLASIVPKGHYALVLANGPTFPLNI